MSEKTAFDLKDFLPYLLNQAAEASSVEFQQFYRARYGMLRTEWRVLFHLGRYGTMTARDICVRARLHKTKVSRAVGALEKKRYLRRETDVQDRRAEALHLTRQGRAVYDDLCQSARRFDTAMTAQFTAQEDEILRRCLSQIANI